MKKKRMLIIFLSTSAGLILLLIYGIYWAFFDISRIKGQELIKTSTSPDNVYTVRAYCNNGGATTDYAVLGVLINNTTHKTKNIYWQYHCNAATIAWLDNETVHLNDIVLNVKKDTYDFRRK